MTLKTWLSANNVNFQKSRMSGGVGVLPVANPHDSPTRGCALPTSCGVLKVRKNKDWKTRSVEDVLETSLEQGDYGFLEYFSLRQNSDTSSQISDYSGSKENWRKFQPTQFYPGTLNRQELSSRKRSRKDRSNSTLQNNSHSKPIFKSDDLRTSTPLSNSFFKDNLIMHSLVREKLNDKPKASNGLLKRNSVLAKLRPDKWKHFEGSLRRSRSRDDVLGSPKKNSLGASQPDLLISHKAFADETVDSGFHLDLPPAPISILPPTCRNAAANASQTLPRPRRHSDVSRNDTFFARGKRWLTGATNKENDRNRSNMDWSHEPPRECENTPLEPRRVIKYQNVFSEPKLTRGATFNCQKSFTPRGHQLAPHPLEQMRCRRPLTFYLLEDYLTPVKRTSKIELDEYFEKPPRFLFQESIQKQIRRTPEWDIQSLSPQSSVKSNSSRQLEMCNSSSAISSPRHSDGRSVVDSLTKSPEAPFSKFHSPASSRGTSNFSSCATPEKSPLPVRQNILHNSSPPYLPSRNGTTHTSSMHSLPQFSPLQSPSTVYNYSQYFNEKPSDLAPKGSIVHKVTTGPFVRGDINPRELERRASDCTDRNKNNDYRYKSSGPHKETLQRIAASGHVPRIQEPSKHRHNGHLTAQKLPSLGAGNGGSTSSSRINLPLLEESRCGVSENDLSGIQGPNMGGVPLPSLNNNRVERGDSLNPSPVEKYSRNFDEKTPSPEGAVKGQPMSPQEAVQLYGEQLTGFEKKEIDSYPEVWYLGLEARKIHGEEGAQLNGGYDDENGSYNKVMHDHISYRYEILEVIGKGSFGQVIRAIDHRTGEQVAIKIIRNKKRFHHQALVEVKILDHLRKRDKDRVHSVIHMHDYFYFRNHLCITFELMGLNLYELIKRNCYQGFGLNLIRRFAYSLVQCLRLLAKENIIHCDLKPENVLLKERGGASIRVIDFGSSCYSHQRVYTYIQSRFYRSPEVILGLPYGLPIDMWSLGCILAELFTGYPLFPGENEVEQLACIMEAIGPPPHYLLCHASRRRLFFDSKGHPRCVTNSKGKKRRPGSKDLSTLLKSNDPLFVDFISKCLSWDPSKRLSPDEALQHEWLQGHSSFSSSSSSSPSQVPSGPVGDRGGPKASKRPGPLTGDAKNDRNENIPVQYRVYKNKKNETSTSKGQSGTGRPQTKESSGEVPGVLPTTGVEPGTEYSLDDSGTYLPPIL